MPNETSDVPDHTESRHASQTAGVVSRWLAPVALLVAVVAVGLAVWALETASFEHGPAVANPAASEPAGPAGSEQAVGDPKAKVCAAFDTVSKAVSSQTNTDLGADPVAQAAVAGNARLALVGGGQYLLGQLDSATSKDLANAVRSFGNDLQYIGMNALAGVPNGDPVLAGRLTQADQTRTRIVGLCK